MSRQRVVIDDWFGWERRLRTHGRVVFRSVALYWRRTHGATFRRRWLAIQFIQFRNHRQPMVRIGAYSFHWTRIDWRDPYPWEASQ